MNKSAEALKVELADAVRLWSNALATFSDRKDAAIRDVLELADLAIAARAVEVAEGMHVAGCKCVIGTSLNLSVIEDDPRCSEARARLRGEMERLSNGK